MGEDLECSEKDIETRMTQDSSGRDEMVFTSDKSNIHYIVF